jgi:uncharacterized protein (DUF1800 family)
MLNPWAVYTPSVANPWTTAKAAHLLRRATFAATEKGVQAALKAGPEATITALLKGDQPNADDERASEYMASEKSLPKGSSTTQLAAWWLARILKSTHPLREKITLFWHNHFATSHAKVQNARFMLGQYRLLSTYALGDFRVLLKAMSTDPAMMVWLDTIESKKSQPNENYARELMELFSLGIGNYTEKDIREAAKAFTGYELQKGTGVLNPRQHDAGPKTVLGQTGTWQADDIVRICLTQPACPRFIATKMIRYLVSDAETPSDEVVNSLAGIYKTSGFDNAKLVETILRSEYFFHPEAYRAKVKSPVEFAIGIVLALQGNVGPLPLAEALEPLGQQLFAPPSVKGWDGGAAWLNGQTLLFRQNLALALTQTTDARFGTRCDPAKLLMGVKTDEEIVTRLLDLFLQNDVTPETREQLLTYLRTSQKATRPLTWSAADATAHRLRTATHLVLTLPEFQLA